MSEKKFMTRSQILDTIRTMSRNQGMYSLIYDYLIKLRSEYPLEYETYMNHLESKQFKTPVDLIMHFEC